MNRKRAIQVGSFVLFLLVLFAVLNFLGLIHVGSRWRRLARQTQITADIANYTAALMAYSNSFGELPVGSNAAATAALTGNNKQRLVFLALPAHSQRLSKHGEFLDPNARPYDIAVTTNRFQILRPSP